MKEKNQDLQPEQPQSEQVASEQRRDFLELLSLGTAAVGGTALLWPLINSYNPSKDVLALASIDVDISALEVGQAITVTWRGKPVFIRRRSVAEINAEQNVDMGELRDPQADNERAEKAEWLVVVGICTHLGCVPQGQKVTETRGDYGGWFCPCHGSHYDNSGRIRKGPAPTNLEVPAYQFTTDTSIRIG